MFIAGTLTAPHDVSYPVRVYSVTASHKLALHLELVHGSFLSRANFGSGGVADIEEAGSYVFISTPFDAPGTSLVFSTLTSTVMGRINFGFDGLGGDQSTHVAFLSPNGAACSVWGVFSGPASIHDGNDVRYPPENRRSICTRPDGSLGLLDALPRDYTGLVYHGDPGGPTESRPIFLKLDATNDVVLRQYGISDTLITHLPTEIAREVRQSAVAVPTPIFLKGSDETFLVISPVVASADAASQKLYVLNRRTGKWSSLVVDGNNSLIKLSSDWLVATVQTLMPSRDACDNQQDTSRLGEVAAPTFGDARISPLTPKNVPIPDALDELERNRGCTSNIAGRTLLYNLADGRKIAFEQTGVDFEILGWNTSTTIVARSGRRLFVQRLDGSHLGAATTLAEDDDVPQIHWMFLSRLPGSPQP